MKFEKGKKCNWREFGIRIVNNTWTEENGWFIEFNLWKWFFTIHWQVKVK